MQTRMFQVKRLIKRDGLTKDEAEKKDKVSDAIKGKG